MAEGKGDPDQRANSATPEVPRQNGTRGNSTKLNHFKKESKTKTAAPTKPSGKSAACKVILLDGEEFECQVDVSFSFFFPFWEDAHSFPCCGNNFSILI